MGQCGPYKQLQANVRGVCIDWVSSLEVTNGYESAVVTANHTLSIIFNTQYV